MELLPRDGLAWWTAATTAGILLGRTSQFDAARALGDELLATATPDAVAPSKALALARIAIVLVHCGQLAAADRILAALGPLEPPLGADPRARAWVAAARGQRAQGDGDPSGLMRFEEATRLLREAGDRRTACDTSIGAGCAWNELGCYDRAAEVLRAMLADA